MFKEEADVVHPDSDVSIYVYEIYYIYYVLRFQHKFLYIHIILLVHYIPNIKPQNDSVESAHEVAEKVEKVKQQFPDLSVDSFPTIH